ncbi:UNVERIFIED_CONTAM: hypothetical protein Slati_1124400 [Sesamum latifolium]|uniref:Uncharacterized protein n=1 Tax=Sesamum latifolium TaxID=2727402 RepID=A0AAW2XCF3_9LAMI
MVTAWVGLRRHDSGEGGTGRKQRAAVWAGGVGNNDGWSCGGDGAKLEGGRLKRMEK